MSLQKEALALIAGEKNVIANLANLSALLYQHIPGLNWCGFYLWSESDQELVLGPFQGKPACLRIKPSRGVCGKAYSTREVQVVADVHAFPDHIACDIASRSELVVPLLHDGKCFGVLDLDAPVENHFDAILGAELERLVKVVCEELYPALSTLIV